MIVRIKADQFNRQYFQPDPAAKKSERDPTYYVDNIKYICTYYNTWFRTVLSGNMGAGTGATGVAGTSNPTSNTDNMFGLPGETPVQHMIRMMSYYDAREPNINYNHLTKNVTTTNTMPAWIRTQKVYSVVNIMKDVMSQMLVNMEFDADNLSAESQSAKKDLLDKLMIEFEMKDHIQKLKALGVTIDSSGGKQFDMPEDIQRHIQDEYRDYDSELIIKIAQHVWSCCFMQDEFMKAFFHSRTAGRCGIEHKVINGKYVPEIYQPYELIVDNRLDDEYNRKAMFVGVIKYLTPEQIFIRYPNTISVKDEILDMAKESSVGNAYNTMDNLIWCNYGGVQKRGEFACVTGYWKTLKDTNKTFYTDSKGNKKARNTREGEYGDDELEDISMGTIIGNRFLDQYGERNNVMENFYDKSKVELPVKVFMPNMNLGDSRSVVSRISDLCDEYNAVRLKAMETVGRSKGKVYFVKGWKFGNNANQKIIEHDIATLGYHVLTHSGEPEDFKDDEGNVLEAMDKTLDPNIMRLYEIMAHITQEILEVAKVSLTSLGNDQVQKYMGLGVQQTAVAQGSGNSSDYTSFMNWVQMNMQYAADLNRMLLTEGNEEQGAALLGKQGIEYLKISKTLRYSNPLIFLKVTPFIDTKTRERLIGMADRLIAGDKIGALEWLEIEMAKSIPELHSKLEYSIKKQDIKVEHQQAVEMQLQQVQAQNAQIAAQNTSTQQMLVNFIQSMQKENLKGSWNLKVAEANHGFNIAEKVADAAIAAIPPVDANAGAPAPAQPTP